jgi:signal transduction histidine kinase
MVLAAAIALGTVATWMGWRLQHQLLNRHRQRIATLADRFDEDVALYATMMTEEEAVQRVIDYRTLGDTALWVESPTGQAMAQSASLTLAGWRADGVAQRLQALSPEKRLEQMTIGDRTLLVCIQPLLVEGQALGTLFIAADITPDRHSLRVLMLHLTLISGGMVVILAGGMAVYVGRSLRPLRSMEQRVAGITRFPPGPLNAPHLPLDHAPTEVRALTLAFNQTLEQLGDLWQQQQRLLGDVSHELRTPLTLVQGYLQSTLRRCHSLTDIQREGLETAAAEADRTIRILQDLLGLARAGLGRLSLSLEPHDLKPLILEAVARMGDPLSPPTAPPEEATPRVMTPGDLPSVVARVDPSALHQVLVQLMDNGLTYSAAAHPVQVRLCQEGNWAVIQVEDQGRGIPAADQAHIFEPFYRVDWDRCRTTGGTGLGLAIARTLVVAMGGQVSVQSVLDRGSTFTLRLPIAPMPSP